MNRGMLTFCGEIHRTIIVLPLSEKIRGFKRVVAILSVWVCVSFLCLFFSNSAQAEIVSHGILDGISKSYYDATGGWYTVLVKDAHALFFCLASIELAWAGILWVMEKDNLSSFTTALIKKIMLLGHIHFLSLVRSFDQANLS